MRRLLNAFPHAESVQTSTRKRWSQNSSWLDIPPWNGTMPPNDGASNILIPSGVDMLLDRDIDVGNVFIEGDVDCERKDLQAKAKIILPRGMNMGMGACFCAGAVENPFDHLLDIEINGTVKNAVQFMGGRLIGAMMGAHLELIAAVPSVAWTQLDGNLMPDATSATLVDPVPGWLGQTIVIYSSNYDHEEAERRVVTGLSNGNRTISWSNGLLHYHHGSIETYAHPQTGVPTTIDMRVEVALLSHKITIHPPNDELSSQGYCAHGMCMNTDSHAFLQGVEFINMGQSGLLGRYPWHWHNVNNGGVNSWMRFCSVRDGVNRSVTVHKTNGVKVSDVVCHGTYGHSIFEEDGGEEGNWFNRVITGQVYPARLGPGSVNPGFVNLDFMPDEGNVVSDPSCFWLTNPNNRVTHCVAAGVSEFGNLFWFQLGQHVKRGSITDNDPAFIGYNPSSKPVGEFSWNRAHSSTLTPNGAGLANVESHGYGVWVQGGGGGAGNPGCPIVVDDFTAWACGIGPEWTGGNEPLITFNRLRAQGGKHVGLNRTNTLVNDSLCVFESSNPDSSESIYAGSGVTRTCWHIYEGHSGSRFNNCVMLGFNSLSATPALRSVLFGSNPKINIGRDVLMNCYQENCELGYVNHELDQIMTIVHDPNNLFGNPSAGIFVHSPNDSVWLRKAGSMNLEAGAIGIPALSKALNPSYFGGKLVAMYWTPGDAIQISISATTQGAGGLKFTRDDSDAILLTSQNEVGYDMLLGPLYTITDLGGDPISSGTIIINLAKPGDTVTFKVLYSPETVFANSTTDYSQQNEDPISQSPSLAYLNAHNGPAIFLDGQWLYVKMTVAGSAAQMRFRPNPF